MNYFLAQFLFYGIPVAALLFFVVSLWRYIGAKRRNREEPGSVSPEDMQRRKWLLTTASVIAGLLAAAVIGIAALLFTAVAFM